MSVHERLFPRMRQEGYRITSPATEQYNCIAWAAGADDVWWDPAEDYAWPDGVPRNYATASLVSVFEGLGYGVCDSADLEAGFEKVAVYGDATTYHHAARQLSSGKWTSKLGPDEDIEHRSPESLSEYYGAAIILRRPMATPPPGTPSAAAP